MTDEVAGVENDGLENDGLKFGGLQNEGLKIFQFCKCQSPVILTLTFYIEFEC